jgi:hypothetical protein
LVVVCLYSVNVIEEQQLLDNGGGRHGNRRRQPPVLPIDQLPTREEEMAKDSAPRRFVRVHV